jgi:protein ImuB
MNPRFLALHLPDLATDLIRRAGPVEGPLATWAAPRQRRVLVAVDQAGAAAGLRPGQALADAQAIRPDLVLHPADPAGEARALQALALWAQRYSPLTAPDPPDGLLLDITGCAHFWADEAALLADALARSARAGIAARGAVAGHAATAAALARCRGDSPVIAAEAAAEAVAPLPLGPALRLPPAQIEALARLGLRRVRDLLALPRGPLARRFGPALLEGLDTITGQRRAPFRPLAPPAELSVSRDLLEPLITRAGIDAVLDRLLEALCAKLRVAGRGARELALLAWRVDGAVQEVTIATGQPSRAPAHLRLLFRDRLEALEPGLGFERLMLEARASDSMASGQQASLAVMARPASETAPALAQLLDRLRQRVRVRRAAPQPSHWPERMVAPLGPHDAVPPAPPGWVTHDAPVLLLARPRPIEVVAAIPDGPPALLRWRGAAHRLRWSQGPRRIAPEWWRAPPLPAPRDYHQVALPCGARLWIYREGQAWHLHGHLP